MSDHALIGSGVEQVEVVATHNVLGLRAGERAWLPVDMPELRECIAYDFIRLIDEDGTEQVPEFATPAEARRCGSCGG
jgi:hypothetical protein